MTWVKHDDGFSQNRKVAQLTDKAYRLHFCALEHCARNLTDGTILDYELSNVFAVAQVKRNGLGYVAELVDAGLWKTILHGYEIHEYLEHNPSAVDVKEQRKRNAERQRRFREQHRNAVTDAVTDAVTVGVSNAAPSHPIPIRTKTEQLRNVEGAELSCTAESGIELLERRGTEIAAERERQTALESCSALLLSVLDDVDENTPRVIQALLDRLPAYAVAAAIHELDHPSSEIRTSRTGFAVRALQAMVEGSDWGRSLHRHGRNLEAEAAA